MVWGLSSTGWGGGGSLVWWVGWVVHGGWLVGSFYVVVLRAQGAPPPLFDDMYSLVGFIHFGVAPVGTLSQFFFYRIHIMFVTICLLHFGAHVSVSFKYLHAY